MGSKTKIDWCDATWNPVTGCLHGCEYCYARKIAERFGGCWRLDLPADKEWRGKVAAGELMGDFARHQNGKCHVLDVPEIECAVIDAPEGYRGKVKPHPYYFDPTLHRYRLGDPAHWKKPRTIFVCSMADLFGTWVPQEWQQEVLKACLNAPQHRYLFLTKAPNHVCQWPRFKGDKDYLDFDQERNGAIRDNIWIGVSFTGLTEEIPDADIYDSFTDTRARYLERLPVHFCGHKFMSIEPIHCDVTELHKDWVDGLSGKPFKEYWFKDRAREYEWIIVGAETGNRKDKIAPERSWIEHLASFCKDAGIPLFMKESLRELMGDDFRQEFPWDMETSDKT